MQVLEGIKVIELVHMPPGELCNMILGDFGAEVIKVEAVPAGDGRKIVSDSDAEAFKSFVAFNALNRNKKSIQLNLKTEGGREVFHRLAKDADVIVEGFRPGVAKRMGVDYATISKLNPRIVYCSLSGYGQDGPYAQYPGHDINYISFTGALNLIGWPGEMPAIPLNFLADFAGASLHGVMGIMLALFAREKTGRGQFVDISYTDSVITLMTFFLQQYFGGGLKFPRGQWALGGGYPYYKTYKCGDGRLISLGCVEPWFWENLCRAIGREDLKSFSFSPEHFLQGPADPSWQKAEEEVGKTFMSKPRDEWFDILISHDVPAGKVNSMEEISSDPQLLHRKMLLEFEHGKLGKVKQPGIALKLSETPGGVRSLAPYSGENTDSILESLGFSAADSERLRKANAIG